MLLVISTTILGCVHLSVLRSADGHFPAEQLFGAHVPGDELSSQISWVLHADTAVPHVWWWPTTF